MTEALGADNARVSRVRNRLGQRYIKWGKSEKAALYLVSDDTREEE